MTQEVEEQTNDLLGPIQCSNKQMAVTVEFLWLHLLPARSLK